MDMINMPKHYSVGTQVNSGDALVSFTSAKHIISTMIPHKILISKDKLDD